MQVAIVLAEEDEHGFVEHVHVAETGLLRALSLVVQDAQGQVPVLPSGFEQPVAQVDVFAIHEEVFVEQSYLLKRRAPEEAESAADNLDLGRLVPGEVPHVVFGKTAVMREVLGESHHLVERGYGGGNAPSRLQGIGTLNLLHAHPHPASLRMGVHEVDTGLQHLLTHDRIGVEQQHVLALALPDGLVVGLGKTQIMTVAHEDDRRKTLRQIFDGTVSGVIVDDDNLGLHPLQGPHYRLQTLLQIELDVIAYDDDRELQWAETS